MRMGIDRGLGVALTILSMTAFAADPPPSPPPAPKKVAVKCRAFEETNIKSVSPDAKPGNGEALIRYACRLDDESEVPSAKMKISAEFEKWCDSFSTGLCAAKASSLNGTFEIGKTSDFKLYILFSNPNRRQPVKIGAATWGLSFKSAMPDAVEVTGQSITGLKAGLNIGGDVKSSDCQIYVSGARDLYPEAVCSGPDCVPAHAVTVANGKLVFDAVVKDAGGDLGTPESVKWIGGPDAKGVWEAAPVDKDLVVSAKVKTKDGVENVCAIKFVQQGQGYNLHVNKYGDCPYFRAVRDYYFLNAQETALQSGGYPAPLTLPGFDAQYGVGAPDIPFRGVLNAAANLAGEVKVEGGQLIMPPPAERRYSRAVVVAKSLDPKTQSVGETMYYGLLNPENYESTILRAVGPEPADDALLIFQFYLAAPELSGAVDRRGTPNGTPYHVFKESLNGKPFDRLVPVVNDSCMPVFQVRAPARADKELSPVMKDAVTCAFSRAFKAGELKAGRALVTVTHFTAEGGGDLFPLDLIKGEPKTSTAESVSNGKSTSSSTAPAACWQIYPNFGAPSWTTGGPATSTEIVKRSETDECSMMKVTETTGSATLGYRWNMAAMAWGFGFAEQVKSTPNAGEIKKWNAAGAPLVRAMVGSAPHTSVLSEAATKEIYTQNFAVRFWGHQVSDIMTDESGEGYDMSAYGGNTVAAFTAPICPGSQFEYANVSLSWSPLILDVAGDGIRISRNFHRSVGFDLKGNGFRSYVDWPENTKDVAFLVRPDARGRVTSMKELFGDLGYENGFAKLATFDSNKDGRISDADAAFGELRLWFDVNRDGIAQAGELKTLEEGGVTWIGLRYSRPGSKATAEEKTLSGLYANGKKGRMMNVEDHYFYEYVDNKRVARELKPRSAPRLPASTK